jgi:hypothetical protein
VEKDAGWGKRWCAGVFVLKMDGWDDGKRDGVLDLDVDVSGIWLRVAEA